MSDPLRHNATLVDVLGTSMRRGGSALANTPKLLRQVLEEDAWREFLTQRGDHVKHARFSDFVTTPPLKGLGAEMGLIERIIGTDDPDLLVMLRDAEKVGHGPGRGHKTDGDSPSVLADDQTGITAARLARDHPDEYAAVKSGDLSINAAAVMAGIRARRISVRPDAPASVARSLRRHMPPGALTELRKLLDDP